jgi:hypothetical protein
MPDLLSRPPVLSPDKADGVRQMQSYLFRLSGELNYILSHLSVDNFEESAKQVISGAVSENRISETMQSQYSALKSIIVKTADVVQAQYEQLSSKLQGEYVATSEFGQYTESTLNALLADSTGLFQHFVLDSTLNSYVADSEWSEWKTQFEGYIKTGLIDTSEDGNPIYGVAIGTGSLHVSVDGETVQKDGDLLCTLTSDRLSFYKSGAEVAYFSNNKMYVTNVEILGTLIVDGWMMRHSGGFGFKYVR